MINEPDESETIKLKNEACCTKIRIWLESNKIFFETIAATFLTVMAIIISYQQTKLTKIQTQIAQQQLVQEERIESIERTANWGELRNAIWEIMDQYPPSGITVLQGVSQEDKVLWLIKIRKLLDSQIKNPVLIEDTESLGYWRNAISTAKTTPLLISTDNDTIKKNEMFIKYVHSIFTDVLYVWERIVLDSDEISATGGRPTPMK